MKNTTQKGAFPIIIIAIVLVLAAGGFYAYSRSKGNVYKQPAPSDQPSGGGNNNQPGVQVSSTTEVNMGNYSFFPKVITVKKGDTVKWTNDDSMDHDVVADLGVFSSGKMSTGDKFSYTFNTSGTFAYHCSYHPKMTAVVVVID